LVVLQGVENITVPGYEAVVGRGMRHEEFKRLLEEAKYMIVFKRAETFGYAVLEALASGVIVLAPPKFSYPEFKSGSRDLLEFVNSVEEAVEFIEEHRWSAEDVALRYRNSYNIIVKYRGSAKRILEEVVS